MKKIPTLFVRNVENMKLVTSDINPEVAWMLEGGAVGTIKKDGTNICVTILDGKCIKVEKRRNPTREEKALGQEPAYIDTDRNDPQDQYIIAAVDATVFDNWPNGKWSCEALGPKIQGGIESKVPLLYPFEFDPSIIDENVEITFESIKQYLTNHAIEGIVWYKKTADGTKFAKIKRRDFGLKWPAN